MKSQARHFPPNPPHTALKVSLGEKAKRGGEKQGMQGPCLPDLRSQTWRDKKQHGAGTLFPLLHHPSQWGILDPCPPKLRGLINRPQLWPKALTSPERAPFA